MDGARPGIVMEAHPRVGDTYRQEFSLDTAEDMAAVSRLDASVTVPYGSFSNCLDTREFTPLAPGDIEHKFYAPGVGFILAVEPNGDRLELVSKR